MSKVVSNITHLAPLSVIILVPEEGGGWVLASASGGLIRRMPGSHLLRGRSESYMCRALLELTGSLSSVQNREKREEALK